MKQQQLNTFLEHAKKELQRYESTKKLIHLQQMGEKMYNAYIYLLECINDIEIRSHAQVSSMARKIHDKDIDELEANANILHIFFYEGSGDDFWIKKAYYKSLELIKKIRRKYKV